jgi:hypothetical protein
MRRILNVVVLVAAGAIAWRWLAGPHGVAATQRQPFVGGPTTELPPVPGGYGGLRPEDIARSSR